MEVAKERLSFLYIIFFDIKSFIVWIYEKLQQYIDLNINNFTPLSVKTSVDVLPVCFPLYPCEITCLKIYAAFCFIF